MRRAIYLLLALLVAACGGDGGGTPRHHTPSISDLKLTPSQVALMAGDGEFDVAADLTYTDRGRDIRTLKVALPDGGQFEFAEAAATTSGTVHEHVAVSTREVGTITVEVWLVDEAGATSNHLTATVQVVDDTTVGAWTPRVSGLPHVLNDVVWTGDRFVAVGDAGTILTSSTGIDWTERTSSTSYELRAVAARGSEVVAVGHNATVLRSTDGGTTWTTKHVGGPVDLGAVAMSASQIVTGGMDPQSGDAYMMRSLDHGDTWIVVDTLPQTQHFISKLIYANDLFVAGTDVFSWESDARVMVSTDGAVWHDIVLRDQVAAVYALVHDGQQFVAAGSDGTVFASPDGYNWTQLTTTIDRVDYSSAAWNGNRLVVAGGISWWYWWVGTPSFERPVGLSSTDAGATWEPFDIDGYYQSRGLAWGDGRFVSVGQTTPESGAGAIYTSD